MTQEVSSTSFRHFIIVWIGQFASIIGSSMTSFAISLWAWELTGKATTLTLVSFFTFLPSILIAPVAGLIIDRLWFINLS